jgi:hypothetical protein
MKNLFVIPTMGMSTLYKRNDLGSYHIGSFDFCDTGDLLRTNQYVYVTNNEYIGLSWYLDGDLVRKGVIDDEDYWSVRKDYKKIVLTNDPKLIEDGVQGIEGKFLDWFVDNSSCEYVQVEIDYKKFKKGNITLSSCYEIIYPTFEDTVERELLFIHKACRNMDFDLGFKTGMLLGDKSKQPILYDESEVLELLLNRPGPYLTDDEIREWFNTNKKK